MLQVVKKYKEALLPTFSGIAVFYFLYFLDAFSIQKGISYSGHSHLFRSAGFGLLTFSYQLIMEFWLKQKFKISTFSSKALWYAMLVFVGSQLTFILFNFFWNWQEWDWIGYFLIQKEYPLMMLFPLSLYLLVRQSLSPKENQVNHLIFCSENQKDQLKIELNNFLFAQSAENYITIHYRINDTLKQHLIRKTLKGLENELNAFSEIKRSHRSYLINSSNIDQVIQKKDKVFVEIASLTIPISKKYQDLFLS